MRALLGILLSVIFVAAIFAQPIEGPFTILEMTNPAGFTNPQITLRGNDIADVFFEMGDSVYHMAVEIQSGEIVSNMRALPMEGEGWSRTLCDVVATEGGWAALVYDTKPDSNRTILFRGLADLDFSVVLDIARVMWSGEWVDASTNRSLRLSLRSPRGFYAMWINDWSYDDPWFWGEAGSGPQIYKFDSDSVYDFADNVFYGMVLSEDAVLDVFEVVPDSGILVINQPGRFDICSILWEEYGSIPIRTIDFFPPGASCVGTLHTEGNAFLLVSRSFTAYAENHQACIFHVQNFSTCSVLRTLDSEPIVATSLPSIGLAWLARYGVGLLIYRADTTGAEHLPAGIIHWPTADQEIAEAALGMAANGKLAAVWSERLPGVENATILKIASVDWDTPLATDDRDFILHPSSFILSAFPNPFNSTLRIEYSLPSSANVEASSIQYFGTSS